MRKAPSLTITGEAALGKTQQHTRSKNDVPVERCPVERCACAAQHCLLVTEGNKAHSEELSHPNNH